MRHTTTVLAACALAICGACGSPTVDEHYARATGFFASGRYNEAIIEFRSVVQSAPNHGRARLGLGDAYSKTNQPDRALREYIRAADLMPDRVEAQMKAGASLLRVGSFEDGKERAAKALTLEPSDVDAWVLRADALAGLKDLDGATADYRKAISLEPTAAVAYARLGALQYARGQRDAAEQTFNAAVRAAPRTASAHVALANFLWATDRRGQSEAALQAALVADPNHVVANRALGRLYMSTGRAAAAEPLFAAVARTEGTTAAVVALANYYVVTKRYVEARRTFVTLDAHGGGHTQATVGLAWIDAVEGDSTAAQARLREFLHAEPRNASALLLQARLQLVAGNLDAALATSGMVIANDPTSVAAARAHEVTGEIHMMEGRVQQGIAAYENVLGLDPRRVGAHLALARLHLSDRNAPTARSYARQALSINPSSADAKSLVVRSDIMAGSLEPVAMALGALRRQFPASPTVSNITALAHVAGNRPDAAYAAYEASLDLAPDDSEALTGLTLLDVAGKRPGQAIARLERRLAEASVPADILLLGARAYRIAGNQAAAAAVLLRAIQMYPGRPQAYLALGQLYVSENRLEDARHRFAQVVALDPTSISAATMVAMLLEAQGNLAAAQQAYEQVLTIDSRAAVAAANLARIYVSMDVRRGDAFRLARIAHQQLPDDPNVNHLLGRIYDARGQSILAVPYLEASVDRRPGDAIFQHDLGMAAFRAGDWPKARTALQRALSLKVDFAGSAVARQALAAIGVDAPSPAVRKPRMANSHLQAREW